MQVQIKNSPKAVGMGIIKEVDKKTAVIRDLDPRKTIQPVLITGGTVSKELVNSGYFFKIIRTNYNNVLYNIKKPKINLNKKLIP